jgi:hypothetical protein
MAKDLFQAGDLVMHSDDEGFGVVLDSGGTIPTACSRGMNGRSFTKVLFADQDIDWIQTRYLSLVCKFTTDMV